MKNVKNVNVKDVIVLVLSNRKWDVCSILDYVKGIDNRLYRRLEEAMNNGGFVRSIELIHWLDNEDLVWIK